MGIFGVVSEIISLGSVHYKAIFSLLLQFGMVDNGYFPQPIKDLEDTL